MKRATKLTGRAKPNYGTPILRFVREVLRQRDLLLLAMEFDGPGGMAMIYLDQDERGERKRLPGVPRFWTTRDRRERDELCLLEDWHNRPDMTLQEFAERASGTRLDTSAVMEFTMPWDPPGRPWKDPRCVVRAFDPRTHRLWQRFRKRAGIPSYLPEFQAAMKEAAAGPAFQVVAPALQALASAHDACLRCVGNRVSDSGDDIEEQDPDDRDWREILNAYDEAMRDLLPFLPAGSLEHDGWAHDRNDPVFMAADLVLQPQDAAGGAVETSQPQAAPELQAGPAGKPQDARQNLPTTRRQRQIKWLAEAMLLVREHPDWSDAEIARRVGRSSTALSRNDTYQAAAAMARDGKPDLLRGHVTISEDGDLSDVEAYAEEKPELWSDSDG